MASCKPVLWHECSIVLQPGSCVLRHTGRYSFDYVDLWKDIMLSNSLNFYLPKNNRCYENYVYLSNISIRSFVLLAYPLLFLNLCIFWDAGTLKYYCYSKMYKFVGPSEVISSKQIKTEIKLDINLPSNFYS
jgi:hypothetical protein